MLPIIEIRNVSKTFISGTQNVHVLKDIYLTIGKGEICCIVGASGSGKTTLLNLLAGLEPPTSGDIILCGREIQNMNETQLANLRLDHTGFIFQNYCLFPFLSAIENVAFPLMLKKVPYMERMKKAKKELVEVGLKNRLFHKPNQMSGGQQQRVGIARAFVTTPSIVFADEPTGNLDSVSTDHILRYMREKAQKTDATLVLVTHEHSISTIADHIVELHDGKIIREEYKDIS